ncbi:MAG: endonuclease [bacterium]
MNLKKTILFIAILLTTAIKAEIPAGYYINADGLKGYELLDALNTICSDGDFLAYGSGSGYTWQGFYYTDRNEDGSVIDMYSDNVRYQTLYESVDGMHIEHSLPKSWWGGLENYAYRDLNHLFPADGTTNITKSALPLGVVGTATLDNGVSKVGDNVFANATSDKCFEPADEYKGDFARAYLYISTVYNEFSSLWQSTMMDNNTYPVWNSWAIDLLLTWHRADPVSQKELDRQEAVYNIQHNRNPFIDYPELVEHIWGTAMTTGFELPEDNRAYLSSPSVWDEIESKIAQVGTTVQENVYIKGGNITENLSISLKNQNSGISLSHSTMTPTEVLNGTDLTITVTSSSLETINDTILISSDEISELSIPLKANFTDQFMITSFEAISANEAEVEWVEMNNETSYTVHLSKYQHATATNLMFAGYIEGSSWNKAFTIYNGTGADVDLKYYTVCKQNNGTGNFGSTTPLSGTLAAGDIYVIAHSKASDDIIEKADLTISSDTDNAASFNGNDALALYHNSLLIDVIGEIDNADNWGENMTLVRNSDITTPNSTFDWEEWTILSIDDISPLSGHTMDATDLSETVATYTCNTNSYSLSGLSPEVSYRVTIEANTSNTKSVNSWQIVMPKLADPEAYDATEIYNSQFTANWDIVPYADGYLLNVFELEGTGTITVTEGFDNVGSSGTPLPDGWSGEVTGTYTAATSYGEATPSLGLKTDGDWIQTPMLEAPMSKFSFLYRFPSSATGSYFIVYAIDNEYNLTQIDNIPYAGTTSKSTLTYTETELGTNCYAVRIEYTKVTSNLAIDDVTYEYGKMDSIYVLQNRYTTATSYVVDNLKPETTYYYNAYAVASYSTSDESISEISNTIEVETNTTNVPENPTNTDNIYSSNCIVYTQQMSAIIENITPESTIDVYDIMGRKIISTKVSDTTYSVDFRFNGVYIITITDSNNNRTINKVSI